MGENKFRLEKEGTRNSIIRRIEDRLGLRGLMEDGLPVKYLPYVFYVFVLLLLYIGNNHFAEKSVRKIDRLEKEVEDLRADYTTLKAEYMLSGKQSEVAETVEELGLEESLVPPNKILIDKE